MKMAEYIDREALKNDIAKSTEPFNTGSVFRAINCQIAADVAPVVHGRWIEKTTPEGRRYFECSNCGAHENKHTAVKGGYCWRCGAKMDGVAMEQTIVWCHDCKNFLEYTKEYTQTVDGANGDCYIRLFNNADKQF